MFLQGTTNVKDLLFWETDTGKQLRVTSHLRDVQWHTYNCPVGWPLLGLFSGGKEAHEVLIAFALCFSLLPCLAPSVCLSSELWLLPVYHVHSFVVVCVSAGLCLLFPGTELHASFHSKFPLTTVSI